MSPEPIGLTWIGFFERLSADPGITLRYINTKRQVADILTKGVFTAAQFAVLVQLCQNGPSLPEFSPTKQGKCQYFTMSSIHGVPDDSDNDNNDNQEWMRCIVAMLWGTTAGCTTAGSKQQTGS